MRLYYRGQQGHSKQYSHHKDSHQVAERIHRVSIHRSCHGQPWKRNRARLKDLLAGCSIAEETAGVPVHSSIEVVRLDELHDGTLIFCDRYAYNTLQASN